MSEAERAHAKTSALEAADLLSRRYLMTDVWARLGVDATGADFARTNEMMTAYRRTIFARVIHTLTDRVDDAARPLASRACIGARCTASRSLTIELAVPLSARRARSTRRSRTQMETLMGMIGRWRPHPPGPDGS